MAIQHFAAMVLFSSLVSVVFAVVTKNTPREMVIYGAQCFGLFVGIAILLGWLMLPFPR